MSKNEIDQLIQSNKNKLSVKEIADHTNINYNTVKRYLDKIGYEYITYPKKPWNKGLTKETNESVLASAKNRTGITWEHTEEARQKISQAGKVRNNVRDFSGSGNQYYYGGDPMRSDFMLEIAKMLDEEKIKWNMDNRTLSYSDNGVTRFISVDFYLEGYNIYISVRYHVQSVTRKLLMQAAKQNGIKVLIIDQMFYRRLKANKLKDILENIIKGNK